MIETSNYAEEYNEPRIVKPDFSEEDTDVEFSLRPKHLSEYIGQE